MLFLILVFAFATIANCQDCDPFCDDYHRFCPAVRDPNFAQKYLSDTESFAPLFNSKTPPKVNCTEGFYVYACPKSCGLCTSCEVLDAEAENEDQLQDRTCNACTETQVAIDSDGSPICQPKFEVRVLKKGECSCWCGSGTKTTEKECITYEETSDGQCNEVTSSDSSKCGGQSLEETEQCNERVCEITKVVEKTRDDVGWAKTEDPIFYKAYTTDNQMCDMGIVGEPGITRENGETNTHNINIQCNNICMKLESETFDHLDVRNDGENAWAPDHVIVTVNGNQKTYYPMVYDDDDGDERMRYGKVYTFVKTQGVEAHPTTSE